MRGSFGASCFSSSGSVHSDGCHLIPPDSPSSSSVAHVGVRYSSGRRGSWARIWVENEAAPARLRRPALRPGDRRRGGVRMPQGRRGPRPPPRGRGLDHVRPRLPDLAERLSAGPHGHQRGPGPALPGGPAAAGALLLSLSPPALPHAPHLLSRTGLGGPPRAARALPPR